MNQGMPPVHPPAPSRDIFADKSRTPDETALIASRDARLAASLALNLLITLAQAVGGIIANSLGLISDAAHNLSDAVALALSLWAVRLGRRPATPTRTFAFKRAEILVALFNSVVLLALSVYLLVEAVRRMLEPQPVQGVWVMIFAGVGLVINTLSALLLRPHLGNLNLKAAFLHLAGDALTSLAVIVSGVIVHLWGWNYADPLVSGMISLWIGRAAFGIVKSAVNVLMEGTPEELEFADVESAIRRVPGVLDVHDLHIWSISSTDLALSAHLVLADKALSEAAVVIRAVKETLSRDFGIGHATLEAESVEAQCSGSACGMP